VSARIFTGRLRVVSRGELAELQLSDLESGELFAACPVPFGQRDQAVEPVSDSSRYFVLRLVRVLQQRRPAHACTYQRCTVQPLQGVHCASVCLWLILTGGSDDGSTRVHGFGVRRPRRRFRLQCRPFGP